jgi:hypothetical protein
MAQQMGMQMPGGAARRGPAMNVYTGLSFLAVVCLGAACVLVWMSASRLAPPRSGAMAPLTVQNAGDIRLE